MSLQLLIDIGLFLIYCAVFTLLLAWMWKFWMLYINTKWTKGIKWTVLEIKLPREINKSPEATEIFLKAIYDGGGLGNWMKEKWEGRVPAYASLEIASLEGVIHFYIRLESRFRSRVESAIYSQYPTVEIIEVEDYTKKIPYEVIHNGGKSNPAFFAVEWKLGKKNSKAKKGDKEKNTLEEVSYSSDMYPIKTYKDWGLDKDPKEMYKHDPLTYLLEIMGNIGKGEYLCHQIIIRDGAKWNDIYTIENEETKEKEEGKKLSDLVKLETDKFKLKWSIKKKGDSIGDDEVGLPKMTKEEKDKDGKIVKEAEKIVFARDIVDSKAIPPNERDEDAKRSLELIQRKMNKPQVIAIMRSMYIADKMGDGRVFNMLGLMRSFNEEEGFNIIGIKEVPDPFDYPWENRFGRLVPWRQENLFGDFMGRGGMFSFVSGMSKEAKKNVDVMFFNYPSYVKKLYSTFHNILLHPFTPTVNLSGFTLNLEELATLYHFPGEVAATPTLPRIDSVKSSSPANLPTE